MIYSLLFQLYYHLRTLLFHVAFYFNIPFVKKYFVHKKETKNSILISGTSTGIGHDLALSLAQDGYTVFAGVRKKADEDKLREEFLMLKDPKGALIPVMLDVAKPNSIDLVFSLISSHPSSLIAVINNAGISNYFPAELLSSITIRDLLAVNVEGVMNLTAKFMPLLRNNKGRVVVVGSLAGTMAIPFGCLYSASKYALEGFCDGLRLELNDIIPVSLIKPGAVKTPIFEKISTDPTLTLSEEKKILFRKHYSERMNSFYSEKFLKSFYDYCPTTFDTVTAITHAIQNPFPDTRYFVGLDAIILSSLRRTCSDIILDYIITASNKLAHNFFKSRYMEINKKDS